MLNGTLQGVLRGVDGVLCSVCAAIVAVFAALLAAQVVLRAAGAPLFWVEEACQYLLVYLTFLGMALAWGRRDHIAVEFLPEFFSGTMRSALLKLVDVVVLVFAVWGFIESLEFSLFSMRKMSLSLPVPVGVGYLGAPIGFGLMALQALVFLLRPALSPPRVFDEVPTGQESLS